jgi:hypothetical protein
MAQAHERRRYRKKIGKRDFINRQFFCRVVAKEGTKKIQASALRHLLGGVERRSDLIFLSEAIRKWKYSCGGMFLNRNSKTAEPGEEWVVTRSARDFARNETKYPKGVLLL